MSDQKHTRTASKPKSLNKSIKVVIITPQKTTDGPLSHKNADLPADTQNSVSLQLTTGSPIQKHPIHNKIISTQTNVVPFDVSLGRYLRDVASSQHTMIHIILKFLPSTQKITHKSIMSPTI